MNRDLIEYKPQFFTFEEMLILGEAARRMDAAKYRDVVMGATIRSMNIPAMILRGDGNYSYSSARLDSRGMNQ